MLACIRRLPLLVVLAFHLQLSMAAGAAVSFSKEAYRSASGEKGIVLISVNWARRWKCGSFENAQLQSLGFDQVGKEVKGAADKADLLLEDSSWLPASASFENYAFIMEPGEYQLSSFKLKAAKSLTEVGHFSGDRASLFVDGKSKAGSFRMAAGEVVYVGHFAVDCSGAPMPWRYYPEDRSSFDKYLQEMARTFPGLPIENAKYRLFETAVMGNPFTLE